MIAEREAVITRRHQEQWILTPNFQNLLLGFVGITGQVSTNEILAELQKAKKEGRDETFPPYFDTSWQGDIATILDQLEKSKFLLHARSKDKDDNVWFLTIKGANSLHGDVASRTEFVSESKESDSEPQEVIVFGNKEITVKKDLKKEKTITGKRIRHIRLLRNMSQRELAAQIKRQTYSRTHEAEESRYRIEKRRAVEAAKERLRQAKEVVPRPIAKEGTSQTDANQEKLLNSAIKEQRKRKHKKQAPQAERKKNVSPSKPEVKTSSPKVETSQQRELKKTPAGSQKCSEKATKTQIRSTATNV